MDPVSRCYPLGGAAFHVLGNADTRDNWGASNSAYIERDADDRLRGFDDHDMSMPSTAADGTPLARCAATIASSCRCCATAISPSTRR